MARSAAVTAADLLELDDEVAGLMRPHLAPKTATLDAISLALVEKRNEAVAARAASGIEVMWLECEEAYVGIDDANRSEFGGQKWSKAMSPEGPVTTNRTPSNTEKKSTAFVRLTSRYVDAGAAKLTEILLPADDKAFSFTATPLPEVSKAKDDKSQVVNAQGVPLTRAARPGEAPAVTTSTPPTPAVQTGQPVPAVSPAASAPPAAATGGAGAVLAPPVAGAPQTPPQVPLTVKDLAEENVELANKKAKLAETRIYDWMVECQYTAEMRKVIFDSARIGVGVVKGPFPKAYRAVKTTKAADGKSIKVTVVDKVQPSVKWCDPWNIYPDPSCGENIHNGDYIFEADRMSERQVRDLKRIPGYIAAQIDAVLKTGPITDTMSTSSGRPVNGGEDPKGKTRYDVWYYYGTLKRDEMNSVLEAAGRSMPDDVPKDQQSVYAIVTMIGDVVVRASFNPLDSGRFPYHAMPWQRRAGLWAGIGVGEQCRMPQRTLNASTRAMLNNAGKSAGCQFIIDHAAIVPANGNWAIEPDKIWYKVGDSPGDDVRKAMTAIEIPNVTNELMVIVKYAMQLAEESTSIPLVTQGQSGPTTPDTYGGMQLQDNNANQLLRSIGYTFDDNITEPLVREMYEWLLLDPDVPDSEKGDYAINAHGSIALVERAIQNQTIAQMAGVVKDPVYGFDPKRWAKMWVKSQRMDPKDFQYTEEEQRRIDSQPAPAAPAIEVAKIKSADLDKTLAAKTAESTADRELEKQDILSSNEVEMESLRLKERLAMLEYANREKVNIETVKAQLAKTAMELAAERELNATNNAIELHKHRNPQDKGDGGGGNRQPRHQKKPAVQVPGRAANGQAASQVNA